MYPLIGGGASFFRGGIPAKEAFESINTISSYILPAQTRGLWHCLSPNAKNVYFQCTQKRTFVQMGQKKHHTHLSLEERRQIYLMLGRKMSAVDITKKLDRHHCTIYREINRNMYYEEDDHKMNGYFAITSICHKYIPRLSSGTLTSGLVTSILPSSIHNRITS